MKKNPTSHSQHRGSNFVHKKVSDAIQEFVRSQKTGGNKVVTIEDAFNHLSSLPEFQRTNKHALKLSIKKGTKQDWETDSCF